MLAGFWFQHLWLEAHTAIMYRFDTSLYGFGNPPPDTPEYLRLILQPRLQKYCWKEG
jgi:hypothetical protein